MESAANRHPCASIDDRPPLPNMKDLGWRLDRTVHSATIWCRRHALATATRLWSNSHSRSGGIEPGDGLWTRAARCGQGLRRT